MTRLLLAVTALVSVSFFPSANAADCRPEAVCDKVCELACATVCRLTCDPEVPCQDCIGHVDPCDIAQCRHICIQGYFCV